MTNKTFSEVRADHLERLEQFTPIVERVHGEKHPEFFEVRQLFDQLNEKLQTTEDRKANLTEEFKSLRKVTNDYQVPTDVCESYEAVYQMLAELDQAYSTK